MSNGKHDPLDEALAGLPREVEPEHDLWPGIEAEIRETPLRSLNAPSVSAPIPALRWSGWGSGSPWKLAATVLLVIGASITAFVLTRNGSAPQTPQMAQPAAPTPVLNVQPASFGRELMGSQYQAARAELDRMFEERLSTLPAPAREKLQGNLNDLRRATQEISAILAEHPSDPLLQQLLLSTYQNELKLLADVTDMTTPTPRVEL
jgi:hypothetical protein